MNYKSKQPIFIRRRTAANTAPLIGSGGVVSGSTTAAPSLPGDAFNQSQQRKCSNKLFGEKTWARCSPLPSYRLFSLQLKDINKPYAERPGLNSFTKTQLKIPTSETSEFCRHMQSTAKMTIQLTKGDKKLESKSRCDYCLSPHLVSCA